MLATDVLLGFHSAGSGRDKIAPLQQLRTRSRVPARSARGGGGGAGGAPAAPSASAGAPTVQGHGTFISSHYRMDPADVISYLRRKNLVFKETGDKLVVRDCPFCHPTRGRADNQWKLYVWSEKGSFFCHRCGTRGSYFDLKRHLGDLPDNISTNQPQNSAAPAFQQAYSGKDAASRPSSPSSSSSPPPTPDPARIASFLANVREERYKPVLDKLTGTDRELGQRGLTKDTLDKYKVGVGSYSFPAPNGTWEEHVCITFPWMRADPTTAGSRKSKNNPTPGFATDRIKARAVNNKSLQRLDPKGGTWGLFGWHTVPTSAKEIVITEGEYDAMAVYQATRLPAVSLPNGARSLPVELLPCLERFETIYLWMDDDVPGHEGAETFAKKLGVGRTRLVRPFPLTNALKDAGFEPKPSELAKPTGKDANEMLLLAGELSGDNAKKLRVCHDAMKRMILESSPPQHQQIATFDELRAEIFREISEPEAIQGLQAQTLPTLNSILKGHRRGELTILTGGTGVGKTTLLSQLSLDYCKQGANTLWGSFEIKNARLAKKMLTQFAGKALEQDPASFDYHADRFAQLPLYFMRFFGSSDVEHVLDAMEYAVYVHDVEHIILDNLQFMLSGQGRNGLDRFDMQDRAIEAFRQFASRNNVHITLVIHPRKEPDRGALGMQSVFGSAKATQEADNVIILQNGPAFRTIEVKKNRFDGDLGVVPYRFDKDSQCMIELSPEDVRRLELDAQAEQQANQQAYQQSQQGNNIGQRFSSGRTFRFAKAKPVAAASGGSAPTATARRVAHQQSRVSSEAPPDLAHDLIVS